MTDRIIYLDILLWISFRCMKYSYIFASFMVFQCITIFNCATHFQIKKLNNTFFLLIWTAKYPKSQPYPVEMISNICSEFSLQLNYVCW